MNLEPSNVWHFCLTMPGKAKSPLDRFFKKDNTISESELTDSVIMAKLL